MAAHRIATLTLVGTAACVFPADSPTGIELSWSFLERNTSDGEDARRVVTCKGPGVETIGVSVVDVDDPDRFGTFRYPCADGFQTADDLARRASDAFLELDAGEYDVVLTSQNAVAHDETLAVRVVDVLARAVTLELWELSLEPVAWTVELTNTTGCTELSLALYYADPQGTLGDAPLDDDGEPVPVLYREMLASDRGLGVGGTATACAELEGDHRFVGVDRGTYRLEVEVDGTQCAIELELTPPAPGGRDPTTSIDVAALPCG